jgi:hypothetical protein
VSVRHTTAFSRRELIALGVVLAVGCSGEDDPPRSGFTFKPDVPEAGASLRLRSKSLQASRAVFELVAHELDDIYAIAFRLSYDQQVLRFRELTRKDGWGLAPELRVQAREGRPGLLLAALTRVGKQPGVSGRGVALAEISFELAERKPSRLDFFPTHSRVLSASEGRMISAKFVGGRLERG